MAEGFPQKLPELERRFSDEATCRTYLSTLRWPEGFFCPDCPGREVAGGVERDAGGAKRGEITGGKSGAQAGGPRDGFCLGGVGGKTRPVPVVKTPDKAARRGAR